MATLYCKNYEELTEYLQLEKTFQAKIVYQFLMKGITDFNKMTSLPKAMRERLAASHPSALSSEVIRQSDSDSAVKLAVKLEDDAIVECVRLSDGQGRYTACLSSEVGCAMGCSFCKTGTMGLVRRLEAGEIVEQFIHLQNLGEKISHIVFMGMGEPFDNFTEVMKAITELHREDGINISYRKITISTCGLVPGIKRLTELKLPIKLAVSLVSADDETRSEIMKVNRTYPLSELKKALVSFQRHQEKRLTLEYCLLSGVNTTRKAAEDLAKFCRGLEVLVNLIPWNPIDALPYNSPSEREIRTFTNDLRSLGVNFTLRRSKGRSADAACGQLASETRRESLKSNK
ncbi:MAG: 23S rRNA (adenine(2503)-C(2))-methyltransferase RlmN [Spirochaetales bacterium]|nr:23S rRNA (adenine(2503)-C(2))-methyltransferase RlmN [Candidatus Physcosoma equi]